MQRKLGIILTLLTAFLFGLYHPVAKLAYLQGANITFVILFSTFFRAFSSYSICLYKHFKIIPEKHEIKSVLVAGFLQAFSIYCIMISLTLLPVPVAIIILFTHTIMLLFYMAYKNELELNKYIIITTFSALYGVSLVINLWNNSYELNTMGLMIAFLAAVLTMFRLHIIGREVLVAHPAVVGARIFSVAFLFTLLLLIFDYPKPPETSSGWIASIICFLSTAVGTVSMTYTIAMIGSFQYSLMLKIEPIFNTIFSYLILNEILSNSQYLGILVIIVSLIVFQIYDLKNSKDQPCEES